MSRERLLSGHSGRLLGSLVVAWAVLQLGRFLLAPLLVPITESLEVSRAVVGTVLGGFQVVYAVTQYPSGRLSDELSRAALIVPGLVVLAAGFLAVGLATVLPVFVLGALLLGLGKGLFAIPSRALLSDTFDERRGGALGLYSAGTDVGGLLASGAAVLAVSYATWRAPFVPIAAVLLVVGVGYAWLNREPYVYERADLEVGSTLRRMATTTRQRRTLAAYALFYFMVGGWINFLPAYLEQAKQLAAPLPALGFALVFVVGMVAKPFAGTLSDRFPRRHVGVAGLLLASGALALVIVAESVPLLAVAVATFAFGYKTQFPVVDALLLDAAPDANVGGDLGAARALFLGVGALGPVYVGVVSTWASYRVALAGLVACLLAAAALLSVRWE